MEGEGVKFVTNAHVGHSLPVEDLQREFDAILLAGGAEAPRDLNVPGRELKGVHFAMDYLPQANKRCHGDELDPASGHSRDRQARHYYWRRRHGRGLPWYGSSAEGCFSPSIRNHADASGGACRLNSVAPVADAVADRGRARRRRQSRVERRDCEIYRRRERKC